MGGKTGSGYVLNSKPNGIGVGTRGFEYRRPVKYRKIGPKALERHLGDSASLFWFDGNFKKKRFAIGNIDCDNDEELFLRETGKEHNEEIPILHGYEIRIRANRKKLGFNRKMNYIFIDDSD